MKSTGAIEIIAIDENSAVGDVGAVVESDPVIMPVISPVSPAPAKPAKEADSKAEAKRNSGTIKEQPRIPIPARPDPDGLSIHQTAQTVRPPDFRVSGHPAQARRYGRRYRCRAPAQLSRRLDAGSRHARHPRIRHGQTLRFRSRRPHRRRSRANPRRLRLHQRLPRREVLSRRQALHHRRRHQRNPAPRHRPPATQNLMSRNSINARCLRWGMLQPDLRRGRIEQKCAPKPPPIRPRKPLQTNGGTDELASRPEGRPCLRDMPARGLTRLTWISGAFCRKSAVSPVCPRSPEPEG